MTKDVFSVLNLTFVEGKRKRTLVQCGLRENPLAVHEVELHLKGAVWRKSHCADDCSESSEVDKLCLTSQIY